MAWLDRLRRRAPQPAAPRRAPLPPPGVIRRERRGLQRVREERLRDLGGLMLEMYRRDRFREDLVAERCNELLGLDARIHELEDMLVAARRRGAGVYGRCECGAPIPWASHFCPNCGRPAGDRPVMACAECEHPLPADAQFCANCGAAVPGGEDTGEVEVGDGHEKIEEEVEEEAAHDGAA